VPGDDRALQFLVLISIHVAMRDPDEKERVGPEDHAAPPVRPPQPAARGDDRAEASQGDRVPGLLGQLPDGGGLDGLAAVDAPAGGQPRDPVSPVVEAKQQDPVKGIDDEQPRGRSETGDGMHALDATGAAMPDNR